MNEKEKKIRFDQQQVLTSLTGTIEASLELTLTSGDDLQMARGGMAYHDGGISLSSTSNHVGDIVLVARGIEDGESLLLALQVGTTHFDGFALKSEKKRRKKYLVSLFFVGIHDVSQEPGLTVLGLGLSLVLVDGSLVDLTSDVEQITTGGRFTGIDVSDEDDVDVITRVLLGDQLLFGVLALLRMGKEENGIRRWALRAQRRPRGCRWT